MPKEEGVHFDTKCAHFVTVDCAIVSKLGEGWLLTSCSSCEFGATSFRCLAPLSAIAPHSVNVVVCLCARDEAVHGSNPYEQTRLPGENQVKSDQTY